MSKGGKSILCCQSSDIEKQGVLQSRIIPTIPTASIVTVPRTQTHMIVTEYGKADLAGRSTWERTERLINILLQAFYNRNLTLLNLALKNSRRQ